MKNTTPISIACVLAAAVSAAAQDAAKDAGTPPPEAPKWKRSAGLGATITGGNSDTILVTANINASKKWTQNELMLGANAAYGEVEDTKNADSLAGFGQYNRLFSDRFYGYARLDALHDAIADVDYRFTLGPGAGYYFIKNKKTSLSAEAGPSFVYEKVGGIDRGYFAARIGEKFEHQFNDRARIWQTLEFLPQVDNLDNFIVTGEIGVESKLTDALSLRVVLQDIYDNEPAPGRKENDIKLISSINYVF